MAMLAGDKRGPMGNINITPLVDVLLVLLIIFMVITPQQVVGLSADVPQPPPKNIHVNENKRTVVIEIKADGSIDINQQPVRLEDLHSRLVDIFATRGERVVFVKGDPNLDFQSVARVIDIAHGSGIDDVGLLTDQMEHAS